MNFHPVGMWETPRPPRAGGVFHISTGTALGFDSPVNCTGAHCCRPTSKRGSIAALVEGCRRQRHRVLLRGRYDWSVLCSHFVGVCLSQWIEAQHCHRTNYGAPEQWTPGRCRPLGALASRATPPLCQVPWSPACWSGLCRWWCYYKEQYITISYTEGGQPNKLQLRRITYKDDRGRVYIFITNNFKITAAQVALIYKHRWMIEILFKQVKQNFPLKYFWGESENAIRIQVFWVRIAQVLMVVIKKKSETKRSFTSILTVVRLHIVSYVELFDFLKDTYQAWRSSHSPPVNTKIGIALSLGFNWPGVPFSNSTKVCESFKKTWLFSPSNF